MKHKYKAIVFDIDGTLTDGKIYIGENGEFMKAFNAHDAVGIRKLPENDILPIVITGRESNIVRIRCQEMNIIHVYQNISNKLEKLTEVLKHNGILFEETIYMGDDENDVECMQKCGYVVCPNDAVSSVKKIADYICNSKCCEAAAREFIELKLLK